MGHESIIAIQEVVWSYPYDYPVLSRDEKKILSTQITFYFEKKSIFQWIACRDIDNTHKN